MNAKEQRQCLEELYDQTGITDVYFHKGVLYVINHYDEEVVSSWIRSWDVAYDVVENEEELRAYG